MVQIHSSRPLAQGSFQWITLLLLIQLMLCFVDQCGPTQSPGRHGRPITAEIPRHPSALNKHRQLPETRGPSNSVPSPSGRHSF